MTIVVTGGLGTLGQHVVKSLPSARPVSRSTGTDLLAGTGLSALKADVVVHCATSFRHEVDMARTVLAARPDHLVYISIVGVDRIPFPYYKQKLAAERLITSSDVPHTILRATQFHALLFRIFSASARLPLMVVPSFRFQPIDAAEVGVELARLAQGAPAGLAPELGGPSVHHAVDLARMYLASTGKRRSILPLRVPGKVFQAYRAGHNLTPSRAVGRLTFPEYLAR